MWEGLCSVGGHGVGVILSLHHLKLYTFNKHGLMLERGLDLTTPSRNADTELG